MAQRIPKLVKPKPEVIDVDPMQPAQLVKPEPKVIDVPAEDTGSLLGDTESGQRGGLLSRIGDGIGNFFSQIDADIVNQISDQIVSPVLESYVADRGGDPKNLATYQGRKRREEAAEAAAEALAKERLQSQKIAADRLAATRKRIADNQDFLVQEGIKQKNQAYNDRVDREWDLKKQKLQFDLATLTGNIDKQRDLIDDAFRDQLGLGSSSGSSSGGMTPSSRATTYLGFVEENLDEQKEQIDQIAQYNAVVGSTRDKQELPLLDDEKAHQYAMKMLERTISAVDGSIRSGTATASPSTVSTLRRLKESFPQIQAYYGTDQFPAMMEQVDSLLSSISEDVAPAPTAADIVGRSTYTSPDGLQIYTVDPSTGGISVRDNRAAVGIAMTEPQLKQAELANKKFEAEQEEKSKAAQPQKTVRQERTEKIIAKSETAGEWVERIAELNNQGLVEVGFAEWLSTTKLTQEQFDQALQKQLGPKNYQFVRDNAILDPVTGKSLYEDKITEVAQDIYRSEKLRQLKRRVSPASIRASLDAEEKEQIIRQEMMKEENNKFKEAQELIDEVTKGRTAEQALDVIRQSPLAKYIHKPSDVQDVLKPLDLKTALSTEEYAQREEEVFVRWSEAQAASKNNTLDIELNEFMDQIREVRIRQFKENPYLRGKVAMDVVDSDGGINSGVSLVPKLDEDGNFIISYKPEITDQLDMLSEELGMEPEELQSATGQLSPMQQTTDAKDAEALKSFEQMMGRNAGRAEIFEGERGFAKANMVSMIGLLQDSRLPQDQLEPERAEAVEAFNDLRAIVAERAGVNVQQVGGAEISGMLDPRLLRLMQHPSSPYKEGNKSYTHLMQQTARNLLGMFEKNNRMYWGSLSREDRATISEELREIPFKAGTQEWRSMVSDLEPYTPFIDVDGIFYRKAAEKTPSEPMVKPREPKNMSAGSLRKFLLQDLNAQ